jgi:AcrR family transcriptional regulator
MGNEHLTLSLIAEEVGCSPPALVQRFGSKRALLMSYVTWTTERIRERFAEAEGSAASPLQRIKDLVGLPRSARPYEITDPEGLPTSVFMHLAAWNDESFRPLVEDRTRLIETELNRLLEQATQVGEIQGCDEPRMARTLLTAFSGASLQAIAVNREPIEERLPQLVDYLLEPYKVA